MFERRIGYILFLAVTLLLVFVDVKKVQNRAIVQPSAYLNPLHKELADRMDEYIGEGMHSRKSPPGAAVCIVRNGQIILRKAYGLRSEEAIGFS